MTVPADVQITEAVPTPRRGSWRHWFSISATAILVPVLLLVVAEVLLRICGVGTPTGAMRPCTDQGRPAYCDNQFFAAPLRDSRNKGTWDLQDLRIGRVCGLGRSRPYLRICPLPRGNAPGTLSPSKVRGRQCQYHRHQFACAVAHGEGSGAIPARPFRHLHRQHRSGRSFWSRDGANPLGLEPPGHSRQDRSQLHETWSTCRERLWRYQE